MRAWIAGALVFLLRLAVILVLTLIIVIATDQVQDRVLPRSSRFGETFDRLGWAVQIGVAVGTIVGVLATHRLGYRMLSLGPRVLHGAVLSLPMLYLWLATLFGR